jgi:potassium-transporting ATPase potassium-binding subunit
MIKVNDILQILFFLGAIIILSPLLGNFLARVFLNEEKGINKFFSRIENLIFKSARIDIKSEMDWKTYTFNLLVFNLVGIIFLFLLQVFQYYLPLNPQKLPNVEFFLAVNTAVSFVTNTNWQSYAGETTMSYFVQMAGLTVQNFVSAGTGIAVLLALSRGLITRQGKTIGNFWNDLSKSIIYILLPLSIIFAIILVSQGTVQTFSGYAIAKTITGNEQTIPLGPAASQIAIKQLGTNGGGFFNSNSSFPYENPNPLTNFLEMLAILLLPASLVFAFGKIIGSKNQSKMIFSVMMVLFVAGLIVSIVSEFSGNEFLKMNGVMEGKETRFGIVNSILWSTSTTAASNGSVNAMHSSLSPLSGLIAMLNIMLGEIIFGGVGAGLYGMLIFIFLTVFISGLMVGRTPEYLGKKIDSYEIKWTIAAVLLPSVAILMLSAAALLTKTGLASMLNKGPHGFSEVLYAFSSAAGNNGSAFAGLNTNTDFYNVTMALAMLVGRYGVIVPCLAIAGSLVKKNIAPVTSGTLSTENTLFAFMLLAVILIVGALTFFPALSLGPLLEHFLMNAGRGF